MGDTIPQENTDIEDDEILFEDVRASFKTLKTSDALETQELAQTGNVEYESRKLQIELDGQEQFLDLQRTWAGHIKWQIWAVLIFQFSFVLLIGFNPWGFTDNIAKLPYMYVGVILQTLANIVALGFVVAKFLFPKIPDRK